MRSALACIPKRVVLLLCSEAVLVISALMLGVIAHWGGLGGWMLSHQEDGPRIAVVGGVCMLCMYYYDLYDSSMLINLRLALARLLQVLGTAALILAALYSMFPGLTLGRNIILIGLALAGVLVAGWRQLFFRLNRVHWLNEPVLIVGEGVLAAKLAEEFFSRPELGVRLAGMASESADLAQGAGRVQARRAIVVLPRPWPEWVRGLGERGLQLQDGAAVYERITGQVALEADAAPMIPPSARMTLRRKRLFSLAVAVPGLLLAWPLMLLISLAIRLDSPGPALFRQRRIGWQGRPFTLFKFRSMYVNADAGGAARPAGFRDARCTRVGRWLRRARLDELPQLWNILRGDMSLVGPRPFVPEQEAECVRAIPGYELRWQVPPGATGWAQVHHGYCATLEDNREKLAYDLFYVKHLSVALDLVILFQTVKILLLGRGGR